VLRNLKGAKEVALLDVAAGNEIVAAVANFLREHTERAGVAAEAVNEDEVSLAVDSAELDFREEVGVGGVDVVVGGRAGQVRAGVRGAPVDRQTSVVGGAGDALVRVQKNAVAGAAELVPDALGSDGNAGAAGPDAVNGAE